MSKRQRVSRFVRGAVYGRPKGVISQAEFNAATPGGWVQAVAPNSTPRKPPRQFGRHGIDLTPMIEPMPALGVSLFTDGRAYAAGMVGWVFTRKGEVIRETAWYGADLAPEHLPHHFPAAVKLKGKCLSLVTEFAGNYGHYLLDGVARIGIAEKAGWPLEHFDHIYLQEPPSESANRMLKALGVRPDRCVWALENPCVIAEQMVVTSFPGTRRNYSSVVPEVLSRPFRKPQSSGRRLYIPRMGARKVENDHEIQRISSEFGLEIFDFSTSGDELEAFRSASLIVGAHGAGLTNLAICMPGTRVLELLPSDHVYPYYYTVSEAAGLDYAYLVGQSAGQREPGTFGPSPFDFWVDPSEYRDALAQLTG